MNIKFNSDDDLPLNKLLKFRLMTIIISEDGKLYPNYFQITLCLNYKNATVRKN